MSSWSRSREGPPLSAGGLTLVLAGTVCPVLRESSEFTRCSPTQRRRFKIDLLEMISPRYADDLVRCKSGDYLVKKAMQRHDDGVGSRGTGSDHHLHTGLPPSRPGDGTGSITTPMASAASFRGAC